MIIMKYIIETRIGCEVLDTYELAEIFCIDHGIHPEEIVEVTEEECLTIHSIYDTIKTPRGKEMIIYEGSHHRRYAQETGNCG